MAWRADGHREAGGLKGPVGWKVLGLSEDSGTWRAGKVWRPGEDGARERLMAWRGGGRGGLGSRRILGPGGLGGSGGLERMVPGRGWWLEGAGGLEGLGSRRILGHGGLGGSGGMEVQGPGDGSGWAIGIRGTVSRWTDDCGGGAGWDE